MSPDHRTEGLTSDLPPPEQAPTSRRLTPSPRPLSHVVTLPRWLLHQLLLPKLSRTSTRASSVCASTRPIALLLRPSQCWPPIYKSRPSGRLVTPTRIHLILRRHGRHILTCVSQLPQLQPTAPQPTSSSPAPSHGATLLRSLLRQLPAQTLVGTCFLHMLAYAPPGRLALLPGTRQRRRCQQIIQVSLLSHINLYLFYTYRHC